MTKLQVQQRVLKEGKPLDLSLFNWDESTSTFSSNKNDLVLDFTGVSNCTFITGSNCIFTTGSNCTFTTGSNCTFTTKAYCTFDTGSNCTFTTSYDCTFDTGSNCTFTTGSDCTFTTGYNCTFDTGSDCTFDTGSNCVIARRDIFEIIQPLPEEIIKLLPYNMQGFLSKSKDSDKFYLNRDESLGEHILKDGILSKVISKKGNIYKIQNNRDSATSYLIVTETASAHGKTIKEARDSLVYKLQSRDTSKYTSLTLESILTKEEAIQCYMCITGACSFGTKSFVDSLAKLKTKYSIFEIGELTANQYGNTTFKKFFEELKK